MKDAGQKELLFRHFRAQGWYALVEVLVHPRGGLQAKPKLITDVDVLALRPSHDLGWEVVIGDCKTKRNESPANRALWVRSLMDLFSASRGVLLLRRDKNQALETDHKLFADSLGVTLLDEEEFAAYDRAIAYPLGTDDFPESTEDIKVIRTNLPDRYPALAPLCDAINFQFWNEVDHFAGIRRLLSAGRSVKREIDPGNQHHLALVAECASVFAVGLATCVGKVFHQYLQPNEKDALDQALKVLIWGGRDQYDYISGLRYQLLESKGGKLDEIGPLALPEWEQFLHIVRSHLEAPQMAFAVPDLLRTLAVDLALGRPVLRVRRSYHPMLLKLAMLTASYFAQASLFPSATRTHIREMFAQRMAGNEYDSAVLSATAGISSDVFLTKPPATIVAEVGPSVVIGDAPNQVPLFPKPSKR